MGSPRIATEAVRRLRARLGTVRWGRYAEPAYALAHVALIQLIVAMGLQHSPEPISFLAIVVALVNSGWALGASSWRRKFGDPMRELVDKAQGQTIEVLRDNTKLAIELAQLRRELGKLKPPPL